MRRSLVMMLIGTALLLAGCVSSGRYNVCVADLDNTRKAAALCETKLKMAEADKGSLQKERARLELDRQALEAEIARAKKELESKGKAAAELDARIAAMGKDVEARDAEIGKLKGDVARLSGENESLSRERARALDEKEKAIAQLKGTYDNLMKELNEEIRKGEIAVTQLKDRLTLNLVEKILFDSGSAEIKKDGKKVLDRVAEILRKVQDRHIRIAGHTDNVPISPRIASRFPSNWELASSRATRVVRYLQSQGVDPKVLSAAGYAEYRPKEPNEKPEGRAANRRIEIVLGPDDREPTVGSEGGGKPPGRP